MNKYQVPLYRFSVLTNFVTLPGENWKKIRGKWYQKRQLFKCLRCWMIWLAFFAFVTNQGETTKVDANCLGKQARLYLWSIKALFPSPKTEINKHREYTRIAFCCKHYFNTTYHSSYTQQLTQVIHHRMLGFGVIFDCPFRSLLYVSPPNVERVLFYLLYSWFRKFSPAAFLSWRILSIIRRPIQAQVFRVREAHLVISLLIHLVLAPIGKAFAFKSSCLIILILIGSVAFCVFHQDLLTRVYATFFFGFFAYWSAFHFEINCEIKCREWRCFQYVSISQFLEKRVISCLALNSVSVIHNTQQFCY